LETRSTLTETRQPGAQGKPFLLILGPDVFSTYELPEDCALVIGRRPTADVFIDDPRLSENHARLVVKDGYFIEDLGSRNGTFLRQQPLGTGVQVRLELGEAVVLGSCLLVVQASTRALRGRHAVSYGFFRIRLDEELARARYEEPWRFCVARLRVPPTLSKDQVCATAARTLRPFDTVSVFAPDEYSLLFSATPLETARPLVASFRMELEAQAAGVRSCLARYPEDGRTPQELEAHCLRMLRPEVAAIDLDADVVASSPAMKTLHQLAARVAQSQISVLITGETGSGKDVLAQLIHAHSTRKGRFQAINCAALPEALLEAQLFGHEKGAFTGADRQRKGLIEAAEGGTVFLDEIAEVPLVLQAKLLRLLETGELQVLGAQHAHRVNVRFLAATNQDLVQAVAAKRFRADLLYRLKGVELRLPPLRERREDIPPLTAKMLARHARVEGLEAPPTLTPGAATLLLEHSWPGNVRELSNVLHRALVLSDRTTITEDEIRLDGAPALETAPLERPSEPDSPIDSDFRKPSRRGTNPSKRELRETLERRGGNQSRACAELGITRSRLRDLMEFYDLPLPRARAKGD
jgi:DNA-binding NtrC family response regulator/pSer/pThr/pTyr-binding forkhead associated (FHA) protein